MNIYIYTPQGFETGGIELLHQLCHELNTYEDINAYIWYSDPNKAYIPSVYAEYGNEFRVTDLPPKGSVLIFPEAWAKMLNGKKYEDYIKVLYWESVYWYEYWIPQDQYMVFPAGTIHMVQSYYAYEWLKGKAKIDAIMVTDYLNDEYMNADLSKPRKRQIVYNPKKGLDVTKRIMAKLPDEKFIPIENMTVAEIKSLMEESMLYIDFGNHPGKDRIPREAAMCGCCVITNREGSAAYYEDVSIPNEYRIDMTCENSLDEAVRMIEYCLNHYDDYLLSADFMEYRFRIIDEKVNFKDGVMALLKKVKGGDRMIEVERVGEQRDCKHCSRTYGTLGCCSTVSNKWVYSCEEGHREYEKTHKHMTIPEVKQNLIALGCMCNSKGIYDAESAEAVKVAIKSLEAWEKVKDEMYKNVDNHFGSVAFTWADAIETIDKHLSEVSE